MTDGPLTFGEGGSPLPDVMIGRVSMGTWHCVVYTDDNNGRCFLDVTPDADDAGTVTLRLRGAHAEASIVMAASRFDQFCALWLQRDRIAAVTEEGR